MMAVLGWTTAGVYVALALVAVRAWWRDRGPSGRWLAASFVTLGVVALAGAVSLGGRPVLPLRVVLAMLLGVPWLLHRFAHSFARPARDASLFVNSLAATSVVLALVGPALPTPGQSRPVWVVMYSLAALAYWGLALADGSRAFFLAARGQRGVILRRLRRLGSGYAALALSLIAPVAVGGDADHGATAVGAAAGVVAGALFLEGFAPGDALRRRWRAAAEGGLDRVMVELMSATTVDEVTSTLLPAVADVTGARSVELLDGRGTNVGRIGPDPNEVDDSLAIEETRLHDGVLRVVVSPWSPLLGQEERRLMRRLGTMADLALDRVDLLDRERRARRDAERATRDRDALLAAVAHDMKGPLTAIHGFAELLLGPLASDVSGRARKFIGRIADNSEFVATLSEDLVDLGGAGVSTGHPQRVVLDQLVRGLREPLLFTHPQVSFEVRGLPVVMMDPTRARQVFDNLITNAVRYAGRDDVQITFDASLTADGSVDVIVRDNGVGIPPEDRERVFELFERLGSGGVGSGLGLAICRRIMQGIGGSIEVLPCDEGACFTLHFPRSVIAGIPSTTNPGRGESTTRLGDVDPEVAPWQSSSRPSSSGRSSSPSS